MPTQSCNPEIRLAEALRRAGYCITSHKHRHVSRIDRPDWREYLAVQHAPWDPEGEGMAWVTHMGARAGDQYRRVHSRDSLVVSEETVRLLQSSEGGPDWFMGPETIRHDSREARA